MGLLVLIAVLAAAGYLISLRLHPWRRCKPCGGTGRAFGSVFKSSHRLCGSCGGNGRRARLGVNLIHGSKQVWGERVAEQAQAKRARNFGR
jgi:DnaJ-class molecular chaperone